MDNANDTMGKTSFVATRSYVDHSASSVAVMLAAMLFACGADPKTLKAAVLTATFFVIVSIARRITQK